jgi:glutaredoxin-related protein
LTTADTLSQKTNHKKSLLNCQKFVQVAMFLKPAGMQKCPRCGFQPQFIQDVEVSEGTLEKLKRKNNRTYTKEEKQSLVKPA